MWRNAKGWGKEERGRRKRREAERTKGEEDGRGRKEKREKGATSP